jgi:predicted dehydrogenase
MAVVGSKSHAHIANAFAYEGQKLYISQREGEAEVQREIALGAKNQFALEMDHFAVCIRSNAQPRTPGEEGLQDQMIMAAIYEAARTGQPVKLNATSQADAYRGPEPAKG